MPTPPGRQKIATRTHTLAGPPKHVAKVLHRAAPAQEEELELQTDVVGVEVEDHVLGRVELGLAGCPPRVRVRE